MALVFVSLRVVAANRVSFFRALSSVAFVDPGPTFFQIHFGHLLLGLLSKKNKNKINIRSICCTRYSKTKFPLNDDDCYESE